MAPRVPERHLFVVLGATGDLMQRKLLPVLYQLSAGGRFPAGSIVLGVARRAMDDSAFRSTASTALLAEKAGTPEKVTPFCGTTLFLSLIHISEPTRP